MTTHPKYAMVYHMTSPGGAPQQDVRPQPARRCQALTTSGSPCQRTVKPGLTVCHSHGGGTAASVRKSRRARAAARASGLWGISTDTSGISIEEELRKLARNKLTDITALRVAIGQDPSAHHGLLVTSHEVTDSPALGPSSRVRKTAGVSTLVSELHKAEQELIHILRLLHEVTGSVQDEDLRRLRTQTARQAASLLRAYPGISMDQVVAEVTRDV